MDQRAEHRAYMLVYDVWFSIIPPPGFLCELEFGLPSEDSGETVREDGDMTVHELGPSRLMYT